MLTGNKLGASTLQLHCRNTVAGLLGTGSAVSLPGRDVGEMAATAPPGPAVAAAAEDHRDVPAYLCRG